MKFNIACLNALTIMSLVSFTMTTEQGDDGYCEGGCMNGGKCNIENPSQPVCQCPNNVYGFNCEFHQQYVMCGDKLCYHNSVCTDQVETSVVYCNCSVGYIGATCFSSSQCLMLSCQSHEVCVTTIGSATCEVMRTVYNQRFWETPLCNGNSTICQLHYSSSYCNGKYCGCADGFITNGTECSAGQLRCNSHTECTVLGYDMMCVNGICLCAYESLRTEEGLCHLDDASMLISEGGAKRVVCKEACWTVILGASIVLTVVLCYLLVEYRRANKPVVTKSEVLRRPTIIEQEKTLPKQRWINLLHKLRDTNQLNPGREKTDVADIFARAAQKLQDEESFIEQSNRQSLLETIPDEQDSYIIDIGPSLANYERKHSRTTKNTNVHIMETKSKTSSLSREVKMEMKREFTALKLPEKNLVNDEVPIRKLPKIKHGLILHSTQKTVVKKKKGTQASRKKRKATKSTAKKPVKKTTAKSTKRRPPNNSLKKNT